MGNTGRFALTVVDHFVAHGCQVHEPVTEVGGGNMVATVKKPNGQLLGLIYNPHFQQK